MALTIDGQGRKVAEPEPLSLSLDFNPVLALPSPDGRYLLLLKQGEPGGVPYIADMSNGQVWPLFKEYPDATGWPYGWHPDSRELLFWFFNNEELRLADVETGAYTILALTEGPVQGAALSPDGQNVVYVGRSGASEIMWKVSAAGGNAQPLLDLGGPSYVFGWSPDGSSIIYADGSGTGFKQVGGTPPPGGPLWLMGPEGQNRRPLTAPFVLGWGFEPIWSPDGQWIAFTGLDEGQSFGCVKKDPPPDPETCRYEGMAIYIENASTGELRRLASGIEPTWSPDGSMLTFLSNQSGAPELWLIQTDGGGLQQLTADGQRKWRITWTPSRR